MAAKKKAAAEKRKHCPRCVRAGREPLRPLKEFPRNRATADGLGAYCRACKRDADRERGRGPQPSAQPGVSQPVEHPAPSSLGAPRNSERQRAPALAITDEMIARAAELIRTSGATRRAVARALGVSENTFKGWLREAGDVKDENDPRRRLLFAIETAEGEAELELTRAYWEGAKVDSQVAQRFLERRFSKGDEKWARTEHLEVSDADKAPMEMDDARKHLAGALGKLLLAPSAPRGSATGAAGPPAREDGNAPAEAPAAAPAAGA